MAGLLFLSYCVFSNIQSHLITTGKETKMGVRVAIHQEPLTLHHRTKSPFVKSWMSQDLTRAALEGIGAAWQSIGGERGLLPTLPQGKGIQNPCWLRSF